MISAADIGREGYNLNSKTFADCLHTHFSLQLPTARKPACKRGGMS